MKALFAKIWAATVVWAKSKSKAVAAAISAGITAALSVILPSIIGGTPINWSAAETAFVIAVLGAFGIVYAAPANAVRLLGVHAKGYIPDTPDSRDYLKAVPEISVPAKVSLRAKFSAIYNQLSLGACTANAAAAVFDFVWHNFLGLPFMKPSRLFVYYYERELEGTVSTDSGAQIRDSVKVLAKYGVPKESLWKYVVSKFAVRPPQKAITAAVNNKALEYARVPQNANAIKAVLASGLPVLIGFTCYPGLESAETEKTGILPMPGKGEQSIGGHAVVVVGYDLIDGEPYWEIRNSWGASWGDHGYFWMPEAYLLDPELASDFWVLDKVS